jgi:hypothetical protein
LRVLMLLSVMGLGWVPWLTVVLMEALQVRIAASLIVPRIALSTLKVWIDTS